MRASMTQAEYLGWQGYWIEEPWGSYRDNLHTAILCREVRRPQVKPGTPIDPNDFMIRRAAARAADRVTSFLQMLASVAKPRGSKGDSRKRKGKG